MIYISEVHIYPIGSVTTLSYFVRELGLADEQAFFFSVDVYFLSSSHVVCIANFFSATLDIHIIIAMNPRCTSIEHGFTSCNVLFSCLL